MVLYSCPRCKYTTRQKGDIRKHFKRKKPCSKLYSNLTPKECLEALLEVKSSVKKKVTQNYSKSTQKTLKLEKKTPNFTQNYSKSTHFTQNEQNLSKKKIILKKKTQKKKNKKTSMNKHENTKIKNNNSAQPYVDSKILKKTSKKKISKIEKKFKCKICNKEFSRKYNCNRHEKKCKEYKKPAEDVLDLVVSDNPVTKIIKQQNEIIETLKTQVEILLKNQGNKTINNHITYNTQIVINPFGQENTSYINSDYISSIIEARPIECIPKLIKYIHFNEEVKENQNVKIPNRKQPYAKVFNGESWELCDKKETIDNLITKGYTIINNHYSGNNSNAISFKEEYEQGTKTLTRKIQKDTEIMMLNCNQLN